ISKLSRRPVVADVKVIVKQRKRLTKKADALETAGKYDEAVAVHAELDGVVAAQDEARRAHRVALGSARTERNYGFVHGGFQQTHIDDIVPLMRAAVLIDVSYHPDSYPS